jgi:hypothetical protein
MYTASREIGKKNPQAKHLSMQLKKIIFLFCIGIIRAVFIIIMMFLSSSPIPGLAKNASLSRKLFCVEKYRMSVPLHLQVRSLQVFCGQHYILVYELPCPTFITIRIVLAHKDGILFFSSFFEDPIRGALFIMLQSPVMMVIKEWPHSDL